MSNYIVDEPKPGFHSTELNKTLWQVPTKYEQLSLIGAGAFGQVCAAYDSVNEIKVAIKKISRPFQSQVHAKRTYREIRMLKHMLHDNIIGLLDVFTSSTSVESFDDLYLVTQYLESDLHKIIESQQLTPTQIQLIIYQMLRAMKYVHSAGIIHRDLKPSNIGINSDGEVRVLDFGLARYHGDVSEEVTGYVATRWYRAPEIILSWMHYRHNVDVWSVGCIMAEMYSKEVLFKGKDTIDQLRKIMDVLGTPNSTLIGKLTSDDARKFIQSLPQKTKINLRKDPRFKAASADAVDLLERMLDFDPDSRLSAEEALGHPYLAPYHTDDPEEEPTSELYDQANENSKLSIDELRVLIYEEIQSFVPMTDEEAELMNVE